MKAKRFFLSIVISLFFVLLFSVTGMAAWKTDDIGTRYYTSKKKFVTESWHKIDGHWFYFDQDGYRMDGRIKVKSRYYYCSKRTGRVTNCKKGEYYYGSRGYMLKNAWYKDNKGHEFYCGPDGKTITGQFTVNDKTYYCTKNTGKVTTRWYKKHYYNTDGVMVKKAWIGDSYVNGKGTITKGTKDPKNPTTKDLRLLGALVYYEAGNQSFYGKQCVASVVLNRMKSSQFPNTLYSVIYQSGQFTPAMNGSVSYLANSNRSIQAQSLLAARTVLLEGSKLKGYYFFNACYGDKKIGDHYFSRNYY